MTQSWTLEGQKLPWYTGQLNLKSIALQILEGRQRNTESRNPEKHRVLDARGTLDPEPWKNRKYIRSHIPEEHYVPWCCRDKNVIICMSGTHIWVTVPRTGKRSIIRPRLKKNNNALLFHLTLYLGFFQIIWVIQVLCICEIPRKNSLHL